jgi:hypothetical protein
LNGNFDQNDAGTILSVTAFSTGYKYSATGSGRYTAQLLGNPNATPVVAPLPFILYASANGRGFLLDQSSTSVITGTLTPQGKGGGTYSPSSLPGVWAAATTTSGSSGVNPLAANFLLTWANPAQGLSGTQYGGTNGPMTGTYAITTAGGGIGTKPGITNAIALTAPLAQTYAIYTVDTTGCTGQETSCIIQDFFMIDVDGANTNPSMIFARQ